MFCRTDKEFICQRCIIEDSARRQGVPSTTDDPGETAEGPGDQKEGHPERHIGQCAGVRSSHCLNFKESLRAHLGDKEEAKGN